MNAGGPNTAVAGFAIAIALCTLWSAQRPADADALRETALRLEADDRLDEALVIRDALVARAPHRAGPLVDRSWLHLARLDFDAALADVTRATELNPFWGPAWEQCALVQEAKGDRDGADLALSAAIERCPRRPNPAVAWSERAALRASRGRLELALADLEQAIAAGAYDDPVSWRAADAAQRALLAQPHDERRLAERRLGDAHASRGSALLGDSAEADSGTASAPDPLGAVRAFDRAFRLDPLASHAYGAARAALAEGDAVGALGRLEQGFDAGLRDWRRIREDARLGELRDDPRFGELLRRMGAP